mmetsp:Transcript_11539/g.33768  ORF Transcript_11539/g.33768 Transcript_11539/m.33768 type:complete len:233 (+) Transcript_11539:754-1452(+)
MFKRPWSWGDSPGVPCASMDCIQRVSWISVASTTSLASHSFSATATPTALETRRRVWWAKAAARAHRRRVKVRQVARSGERSRRLDTSPSHRPASTAHAYQASAWQRPGSSDRVMEKRSSTAPRASGLCGQRVLPWLSTRCCSLVKRACMYAFSRASACEMFWRVLMAKMPVGISHGRSGRLKPSSRLRSSSPGNALKLMLSEPVRRSLSKSGRCGMSGRMSVTVCRSRMAQ